MNPKQKNNICKTCKEPIKITGKRLAKYCKNCRLYICKTCNEFIRGKSKNPKYCYECLNKRIRIKKNKYARKRIENVNRLPSKEVFFSCFRHCKFVHEHDIALKCTGEQLYFDWGKNQHFRDLFYKYKKEFDKMAIFEHWENWLETDGVAYL